MIFMITFKHKGNFKNTEKFFARSQDLEIISTMERYGRLGVEALSAATPERSGKTAKSWGYEIKKHGDDHVLYFSNSSVNKNVNIAVILQYGHGTGTGGYVKGIDYINPAVKPIFDAIVDDIWSEVTR